MAFFSASALERAVRSALERAVRIADRNPIFKCEPKCTTASQPQSLAIFESQAKSQGISAARSEICHFSSQNASQPQPYRYRREIATYFPERIAAYSLNCVNESQTLTANHRRETVHLGANFSAKSHLQMSPFKMSPSGPPDKQDTGAAVVVYSSVLPTRCKIETFTIPISEHCRSRMVSSIRSISGRKKTRPGLNISIDNDTFKPRM